MPKNKSKSTNTISYIAERCGISKMTVSRALADPPRSVSDKVLAKVRAVADEIGYDPSSNYAAKRLAAIKSTKNIPSYIVALLFPFNFQNIPYFLTIYKGLMDVFSSAGYGILSVYFDENNEDTFNRVLPIFLRGDIDGVMAISDYHLLAPKINLLRKNNNFGQKPVISMAFPAQEWHSVTIDDLAGGYAAAAHLLDLGHQKILHSWEEKSDDYPATLRLKGANKACLDRKLNPKECLHFIIWDKQNRLNDIQTERFKQAFRDHPDITAVLAPNDHNAQILYNFLISIGKKIPEDISLIGFDDSEPIYGDNNDNILTTIRTQLMDIGRETAKIMLELLANPDTEKRNLILPTELIIRKSTAPRLSDKQKKTDKN